MENKEIYIDGVNVAECRCFIENTAPNVDGDEFLEVCENVYTESCYCENNKDCTFKQLKRLEQELKEKDNFLKWLITQQYYIIPKNLKQKIKEILKDV